MDARELLVQEFEHMHQSVREDLAEIDQSWLWWQPAPKLSHIGFLYWHLVRDEDTVLGQLAGEAEIWQSRGWHERLGMDAKAQGTGFDPVLFPSFRYDLSAFEAYRDQAWKATSRRLAGLDMAGLEAPAWTGSSWNVAQLLVEGCLGHSWLHLGEIRTTMGLRGWRFRE